MNLLEFAEEKRTGESGIIYGAPKSGKTELAGTLAEQFNLIWFDLENGLQTLIKTPRISQEGKKRISVISIPDTKQNPVAIETMLKVLIGGPVQICHKHGKVACSACTVAKAGFHSLELNKLDRKTVVVIDSGTQLSDSAWATVVGPNLDAQTDWKSYDKWNQRIAMCLSFLQQAPYHSILIAHGLNIETQDGRERIVPKMGTKAFSENVSKYFSHVIYTENKLGKLVAGSTPEFSVNALIGNRAGLKLEPGKVSLSEFFK